MSDNGLRRVLMERMAMAKGGKVRRFEVGGYADRGYESDAPAGDIGGYEGDNGPENRGNDTGTDSLSDSWGGNYGAYGGTAMGLDGMGGTSYGGTTGGTIGAGYGASGGTGMGLDGMGGTSYASNDTPNTGARAGDSGGWDPNYDFGDFSDFQNEDNYDHGLAGTVDNGGAYDGMLGGFGGVGMGLSGLTGDGSPFSADHGAMANAASDVNVNPPDVPDTPTPGVDPSAGLGAPTHEAALAEIAANAMALPSVQDPDEDIRGTTYRGHVSEGTLEAQNLMDRALGLREGIGKVETGYLGTDRARYNAQGVSIPSGPHKGTRAQGMYQEMPAYLAEDTLNYYGKSLSPKEFRANPEAQRAVAFGTIMGSLTGAPGNPRGHAVAENFGYGKRSDAQVAGDYLGRGRADLVTGLTPDQYASRVAGNMVAGDPIPDVHENPNLGSWAGSFEYAPANAPAAPAQAYDGIPEGDYDPEAQTPASGLPTASEQYNMIDVVPTFAQPFAEPTYTREKATRPGSGPFGDEMAMTPYGAWQNTTLGLDPISYGTPTPAHEVPGPTMPGTQYAGDAVPTRPGPPASLTTPATTRNGLPTTLDTGPLEAAHRARVSNYQGFNPDGTFPERGVVAQPTNAMFGPATKALDIAAGLTPFGLPNTLASLAHAVGLPVNSIGGYTREHAVPGIDISRGNELNVGDRSYQSDYGAGKLDRTIGGKTDGVSKPVAKGDQSATGLDYSRNYTPPSDVLHYGYHPEQVMFKAKGGKVDLSERVKHFRNVLEEDFYGYD